MRLELKILLILIIAMAIWWLESFAMGRVVLGGLIVFVLAWYAARFLLWLLAGKHR